MIRSNHAHIESARRNTASYGYLCAKSATASFLGVLVVSDARSRTVLVCVSFDVEARFLEGSRSARILDEPLHPSHRASPQARAGGNWLNPSMGTK